jgi:hypothetical protein
MNTDNVDHARAIRSTPDEKAQSSPHPIIGSLINILSKLLIPPILLAELPFLIYTRLLRRRSSPKWSFLKLIGVNVMRINGLVLSPWMPQPYPEQEQWGIPSGGRPYRDEISSGELEYEVVKLDPVGDDMRKGIADVPQVRPQSTPGFWFKSKGGRTDKVILYIHGGYVIVLMIDGEKERADRECLYPRSPHVDPFSQRYGKRDWSGCLRWVPILRFSSSC